MATTTKKTSTKPKTKISREFVKKQEPVNPVVEDETVEQEVPVEKEKKHFEPNTPVLCRSVTQGRLFMEGNVTKMTYQWDSYGDEIEVEYRDLASAVRSNSSFVFRPFIVVSDNDFVNEFPTLAKFYREKFTVKDFNAILRMSPNEMKKAIEVLPEGAKEQIMQMATAQISSGAIDSIRTIKALDEVFGADFNLLVNLAK